MDNLTLSISIPNLLIAQMFILSFFVDFKDRTELLSLIRQHKIPFPRFSMYGGMWLKLLGGLGLLYTPAVQISAYALIIFTAIATLIFHAFWKKPKAERKLELLVFSMCFAVIGGLFTLV